MIKKRSTGLKNYIFKTNINSIYQKFWITYEIVNISPNIELNFMNKKKNTVVFITNTNLSSSDIKLIFKLNLIDYEEVRND